MIEVKVPKDIRNYKESIVFGLSLRQTLCAVAALIVNVPLYIVLQKWVGADLAGWIIILVAVPFILVGFVKYNGMPFEQVAVCAGRFFLTPQKYPYETENYFRWLNEECRKEKNGCEDKKGEKRSKRKEKSRGKADC